MGQEYDPSVAGAVAEKVMSSVPPGHSAFSAPGGEIAWMKGGSGGTSNVTVQSAAEQVPAVVVVATSVEGSTVNPAGISTCPLFAASVELLRLLSAIVYVRAPPGTTSAGVMSVV